MPRALDGCDDAPNGVINFVSFDLGSFGLEGFGLGSSERYRSQ